MKLDRSQEKRKYIDGMPQSFKMALAVRIARRLFPLLQDDRAEPTPAIDIVQQAMSWMESFCRDPPTAKRQLTLAGQILTPDVNRVIKNIAEKKAQEAAGPATTKSSILVVDYSRYDNIIAALTAALRVSEIEQMRIIRLDNYHYPRAELSRNYTKAQAFVETWASHAQLTTDLVLNAWEASVAVDPRMEDHLWSDLETSHHVLNTTGGGVWRTSDPVPEYLYLIPSEFDLTTEPGKSAIREIVSVIDEKLIADFRKHPNRIKELNPRQFEELIREIVDGFGWEAKLTSQTVDGGCDIVAIDHRPPMPKHKYLIECKRYTERAVSIVPVRSLLGVIEHEDATKGIIVTTTRFTKPARAFLDEHKWRLEGRDFQGLLEWLELYQQLKLSQALID